MASNYYVGLAASSGDTTTNTLETSTFDNVSSVGTVITPTGTTLISDGTYEIISLASGLSFEGPKNVTAAGTQQEINTPANGVYEHWTVNNLGSNLVTLQNVYTGLFLDVSGASTLGGASAVDEPMSGGTDQEWEVVSAGTGAYALIT